MKTLVLHRFCQFVALGALGLWVLPHSALAQANPNPQVAFPPAPNAASLGEYGAIPVSNYTGLANITVPLHSIATKSNRVELSLSYRASGIRVEEEASWVGLGWSLNAGGVVTRSLQGLDDLDGTGYAVSGALPPWDANNNYNPAGRNFTTDKNYFLNVCDNRDDTQPDLFYYNFGQHSGKFVLEKSSTVGQFTVRLIDNADNSSIVYKTLATTGQKGWAIVTGDGYTYNFGSYETTTVTSVGVGTIIQPYTSSWYLTEIVAPNGEQVTFAYDTNFNTSQESRSFTNGVYFDKRVVQTNGGCGTGMTRTGAMPGYPTTPTRTVSQTMGVVLKSITYANGIITFSHTDRDDTQGYFGPKAQRITGFTVSNNAPAGNQIVKVVSLRQSYFNAGAASPNKNTRLRLDAVGQSNQGQVIPDHVFTYYTGNLPSKESYNKDFLGYYNGANNDALQTDIPTLTIPLISNPMASTTLLGPSANRNPDAQYAQTSSLREITYPTGGKTLFEYESRDYRDANNALQTGCGLRIARITSTDDITGNSSVKRYSYTLPNSTVSSGRKLSPENYLLLGYESVTNSCLGSSGQSDYFFYFAIRSSSSTMALSNSAQGQPYGYDFVTVLEGENGENGKTEYSYTNVEDQLPVASFNTAIPNKINVANGNLLLETVYKKNKTTNTFDKVAETENNYSTGTLAGGDLRIIKGCIVSKDIYCGSQSGYTPATLYYGVKYYDIQTYWTRLNSTVKRAYNQYNPALFTQTSTTYQYGSATHRQVTMTAQTLPTGEVLREYQTYPSDYTSLSSGPVFDMANSLHVLNSPVETYSTVIRNNVEQLTGGKFITYAYAKAGNALVCPTRIDQLRLSSPAAFSGFTLSTPALQKDPRYFPAQYMGYNQATGNIEFSRTADDAVESYQWDYQYQQPVASFKNADRTVVPALPGHIGNEASFMSFESGQAIDANPQEDYWLNTGTGDSRNYLTATAHTGQFAWRVGPVSAWSYNYGPAKVIAPSRQATQYKLSAWVNTETGFRADGGQLILSVNDQNDNQVNTASSYVPVSFGDTQGKWKYVEAIIDLKAVRQEAGAAAGARYRVVGYACNTGGPNGNSVGFRLDDLRLHPVDAQAVTYTYDAATHLPTSVSDANSRPVYYEYDALQRLVLVKDDKGNIVKQYQYHYKQ